MRSSALLAPAAALLLAPAMVGADPLPARQPLVVKLDETGPYAILASHRAAKAYAGALKKAKTLHPKAERADFDPANLVDIHKKLRQLQPRFALVFIEPDELDVNFAWRWLEMTSRLDDDPFVDVRTGFMTGLNPKAVEALIARTAEAVAGRLKLPPAFVDNCGPREMGNAKYFNTFPRSDFVPALTARFEARSIFHGKNCFTPERVGSMDGAGLVHFGGHGYPNGIDNGLSSELIPKLKLAPCVVFNGACYAGVTGRWYDAIAPKLAEKKVRPEDSFCLRLLERDVLAYLASLHPDHGMPVYQELEHLAFRGGALGGAIKATYDGVVLGNGGKLPAFPQLKHGAESPRWQPADFMLHGTAARVLIGDPALVLCDAFAKPPFAVAVKEDKDALRITATLENPDLKCWLTDTYHNDLNAKAPFNDRALLIVTLPKGWQAVGKVKVNAVRAGDKQLKHRLVGHAIEHDRGARRLHIQVDVASDGFQRSVFRRPGSTVELAVTKP